MTRTRTPRCLAAITACSNVGSVNRNIRILIECLAASIGSRINLAVSSGRTLSLCDMSDLRAEPLQPLRGFCRNLVRGVVLNTVEFCVNSAAGEQLVVRTLLGHDAILQHDDLVGI